MKKIISRIAIVLAVSAPAAVALAHGGRWGGKSPEERQAKRAEILQKYDADKDGKLSDAERDAARKDFMTARFNELDANKDGKLSLDEFVAGHQGRFHHGGGDHDGGDR